MAGPWEKYGGQPSQAMTVGAPSPFKAQSQSQDLTKGAVDIQRGQVGLERDKLGVERERIELEKLRAGTEDKKATVEQGKAAGFHSRAVKSNQAYGSIGIGAPSLGREGAQAVLPDGLVNQFTGPERQQAEALEKDFIAATLRYESGAAIPPEELETQRRIFFPVAGDSPDTITLKAQLRENVIEALRMGAGSAAVDVPAIADETIRHQLEQRVARGDAPQDTIKWLVSIGRPPTPDQIDRIFANAGNTDPRVLPPQDQGVDVGRALGVGAGGVLQGAGDIANLVSTPFIQGVNAVTGSNFNPDMGANLRDVAGTPDPQNNAENIAFAINRGGTAALGLSGAARAAVPFVQSAPVSNALANFASRPLTDMAAGSGAATGAEVTRQQGGGPVAQGAAALVGGAATLPISGRVNALMNPGPTSTALTRAGQAEGVTVNRAMVDPDAQQRLTGVGKTMVGGKMMHRDMRKVGDQIEGRVERLGQGGTPLDPSAAGQTVERAGERFIKTSGQKFGRIYDALDREVGSVKIPATNALKKADEVIARLSETGETHKAEISFLEGLKKDLGKNLSVGALRDMRTTLRKKISKGDLTFGPNEQRVLSIMEAASDDIASGLTAAGKGGAAARFKRLDADYAQRMDFIKNTVQKLVGKRDAHHSPEQIFANLKAMASPKGDSAGLARMIREMNPEEQADISATFANALGKNADGDFSTAYFVKQLEKLPRAARVNIFGVEGAKSLDNLSVLAKEHKRVTGALGGSPTGLANDWRSWLTNLFFGGGAGMIADGATTAAATGAAALAVKGGRDAISARLLMSPNVTKWLRSAPRTASGKAIDTHFARLKAIATREPAIAPEIQQLQQLIMKTANENAGVSSAAASDSGADAERD